MAQDKKPRTMTGLFIQYKDRGCVVGLERLLRASSAIAPALLYHPHPCRRALRPSGVLIRNVQGCTGAVKHTDVRERLPDEFVELLGLCPGVLVWRQTRHS
jgi:hypothetical protein